MNIRNNTMTKPIFYRAERFFPTPAYEAYSLLIGHEEIVTYDILLCRVLCEEERENKQSCRKETYNWHTLLSKPLLDGEQIIACYKSPEENHMLHKPGGEFIFCGYDLCEKATGISAIANCGMLFADVIPYTELNRFGLIGEYSFAFQIRTLLEKRYPYENHAVCEVYELWRMIP